MWVYGTWSFDCRGKEENNYLVIGSMSYRSGKWRHWGYWKSRFSELETVGGFSMGCLETPHERSNVIELYLWIWKLEAQYILVLCTLIE